LFNAVLAAVRSRTQIAIATAFSGIAALLLKGGRTFHSRCGIPIKLNESSVCSFKSTTELGKLLKQAAVIIIDEAPMCDRFALEAFDRSMRNLMRNDKPFGGKVLLLGGDFRQTLTNHRESW
jgi:ATP-dependent DNA helicase PIF1